MRNLKSLVTRLSAMGLAASLLFSVSLSAAGRASKEEAAKVAILNAIAASSKSQAAARKADKASRTTTTYTDDVVIGSSSAAADLVVYGDSYTVGQSLLGAAANSSASTGTVVIQGVEAFDPKTQQLKVTFKDKTLGAIGATVDVDFMTTATRKGVTDIDLATVHVKAPTLYFHPQSTVPNTIRSSGITTGKDLKSTTTVNLVNAPALGTADFRMTPTIRHEAITDDIAIGFVPYNISGTSYYDTSYVSDNSTNYYTFNEGIISYRIVSNNVAGVSVVTSVDDTVEVADVFTLFTDAQLQELLEALQVYFGSTSKALEYLSTHRAELGDAVRALRS